ncbi:MAG TPA: CBS domain-containing protein [Azospirillaceae bacterium]|nr:CBS domain-containing protein [Azospirillaceae bacterium]
MKIREIMTKDVEVITPDTPLREAARMMRDADTGFLPVGENDRLVGTVTDRDIAVRCVAEGADPNSTPVRHAMSENLVYATEDQDATEAARLMQQHNVRRLPVLSGDKRLVGVVSLGDLAVGTDDESQIARTEGDIASSPPNN